MKKEFKMNVQDLYNWCEDNNYSVTEDQCALLIKIGSNDNQQLWCVDGKLQMRYTPEDISFEDLVYNITAFVDDAFYTSHGEEARYWAKVGNELGKIMN